MAPVLENHRGRYGVSSLRFPMHTCIDLFFPLLKKQQNPILKYILLVAVSLSRSWLPFFPMKLPSVGGEGNVGESITPEVTPRLGGHNTVTCVDSDLGGHTQWPVACS